MRTAFPRALSDAAISVAALFVLLATLVSIDDRVRERVGGVLHPPTSSELAGASQEVGSIVSLLVDAVRDQSMANGPMVIFAVAATVLVLFMLRT
jgi:hypothetical protein